MVDKTGKRNFHRYDQEALISWSYFNASKFTSAKLLNYSKSGLCFESELKLQPGAGIYIRLEKLFPHPNGSKLHEGFRTVTLGEARWCRETGAAGSCKYVTGIKYYTPDY